jgi:hypothetical protein
MPTGIAKGCRSSRTAEIVHLDFRLARVLALERVETSLLGDVMSGFALIDEQAGVAVESQS